MQKSTHPVTRPAAARSSTARRLLRTLLDAQVRVAGPYWDGGRPGAAAAARVERRRTAR